MDDKEGLFEKNLEFLKHRVPDLHRRLVSHQPTSELVRTENGEWDVVFRGVSLYPDGDRTTADKQIEEYWAGPRRQVISPMVSDSVDQHVRPFLTRMIKRATEADMKFGVTMPTRRAYFTIVMGLGLGTHLESLVEDTQCRCLVIIEPNFEFVYHSLEVMDWEALFSKFDGQGEIVLRTPNSSDEIIHIIRTSVRGLNPSAWDGTVIFVHYANAIFFDVLKRIGPEMRTTILGLGFFEDEMNMITQSFHNLKDGKARVVDVVTKSPGLPVVIVGSGPSLDKSIGFLKENRDKVCILACGTGFDPVLAAEIQPDFYVVVERSPDVFGEVVEAAPPEKLKTIRMVASTTVFPELRHQFRETIFYFRGGLSSFPVFCTSQDQCLRSPDPQVVNAGESFAQHVGFDEIYLLGVDCGTRDMARSHAANTMYQRRKRDLSHQYRVPLPGNFGGTVYSRDVLIWSKETLENSVHAWPGGRKYINLSDGALIRHFTPRHISQVKLPDPPRPKEEIIDELVERMPSYSSDMFQNSWLSAAILDSLVEFRDNVLETLDAHESFVDWGFQHDMQKYLKATSNDDAVPMIMRGSVWQMLLAYEYYSNRLLDEEQRPELEKMFREEFRGLIESLTNEAIERMTPLEEEALELAVGKADDEADEKADADAEV